MTQEYVELAAMDIVREEAQRILDELEETFGTERKGEGV